MDDICTLSKKWMLRQLRGNDDFPKEVESNNGNYTLAQCMLLCICYKKIQYFIANLGFPKEFQKHPSKINQ